MPKMTEEVKQNLARDMILESKYYQGRLCYDCENFEQDTLKCPKRLGKTGKPTYVYTPTKAQLCHSFREIKK